MGKLVDLISNSRILKIVDSSAKMSPKTRMVQPLGIHLKFLIKTAIIGMKRTNQLQ